MNVPKFSLSDRSPPFFDVLDFILDTTNADQLATLYLLYDADVEATLATAAELKAAYDEEISGHVRQCAP